MMILLSLLSFVITIGLPGYTEGHGHLVTPRSRNWLATPGQNGSWTNSQPGVPGAESCPHCLNKKGATELCGIGNGGNYDDWLDSTGVPMQWNSQATLQLGVPFEVQAFLDTNHAVSINQKPSPCFDNRISANISYFLLGSHGIRSLQV